MILWRSLLLIYPRIDVRLPKPFGFSQRFVHEMPPAEIKDAVDSFRHFPALVNDLTHNEAGVEYNIITCERTLSTLSSMENGCWWPSPTDVQPELLQQMGNTRYHSVFVFWPQNNLQKGTSIKSAGWGLGMGPSPWSMDATYATVANIHLGAWQIPLVGEVWLHEWLHGACAHFASRGHVMPKKNVDGADSHGYVRSPTTGWTDFYRDLMTCHVSEDGKLLGIPLDAWRERLA